MTKPLETANYLKQRQKHLIGYEQLHSEEKMDALKHQEKTSMDAMRLWILAKIKIIPANMKSWCHVMLQRYHTLRNQLRNFFHFPSNH